MTKADLTLREEAEAIEDVSVSLTCTIRRLKAMPAHRSYSLAVTKLEEAAHWLSDRRRKLGGVD